MSVNIEALFQHLMEDPDLIPPEGEEKEDIAMAMATQRAKQSKNNVKALNMASEDRTISKLLAFLKAEGDTDEEKAERAEFYKHEKNFGAHEKRVLAAAKTGTSPWMTRKQSEAKQAKLNKRKVETVERPDDQSYEGEIQQKEWEDAHAFFQGIKDNTVVEEHNKKLDAAITGVQEAEGDPDADAPATAPEVPAPKAPPRQDTELSIEDEAEQRRVRRAARAGMTDAEKKEALDSEIKAANAARVKEGEAAEREFEAAARAKVSVGEAGDETPEEDKSHPFHPSKFGDGLKEQQGYHRVMEAAGNSSAFLESVLDWNTRPMEDKGDPDHPTLEFDDLPGNGRHPYSHHDGGNADANINPDKVIGMIRQYNEALEDKGKEAKRVEGEPIDAPKPSGARSLSEWSGKATSREDKYSQDMDGYLDRFLDGYAPANPDDIPQQKGRRNSVRTNNVPAAEAFDGMRAAWSELGLQAKREAGDIDDAEYYEGLDKFIRDNMDAYNSHYRDPKKHIRENSIPKAPKALPDEDTQNKVIEILPLTDDAEAQEEAEKELPKVVAEASNKITTGKGSTRKKKSKVQDLNDFAEAAAKEVKVKFNPPSEENIDDEVARNTAANVASGDQDPEELEGVEELVGEEEANQIVVQQNVPESSVPMSRAAKNHLRDNGIDPDGSSVAHVKTVKEARQHVTQNTPEPAHVTAIREREAAAGTARVQADRDREHNDIVNKLRNINTTDKEGAVAELHAMGERHSPGGGGDAAVQRARENLEAIGERDPKDPSGPANNTAMHRALGGTPAIEVAPAEDDDYEEGDEDLEDDVFTPNATEAADRDHGFATEQGWGGNEVEDDHFGFDPSGEVTQKGPQGYAHEVKAYAEAHQTDDIPLIGANSEPHDDIYDYHGLGDEEPVTIDHIKDYMQRVTGEDAPKADWETQEKAPDVEVTPEPEADATPAKVDDLDALKTQHDELAQQFTQLQTDLDAAKALPDKTRTQKRDKEIAIKVATGQKRRVGQAGKRLQAKIAAHPDTPTETEEVEPTEETSEEAPQAEPEPQSEEATDEPAVEDTPEAGEAVAEPVGDEAPKPKRTRKPRTPKPEAVVPPPKEPTRGEATSEEREIGPQQGLQGGWTQTDEDVRPTEEGEEVDPTPEPVDPRQGRLPGFEDEGAVPDKPAARRGERRPPSVTGTDQQIAFDRRTVPAGPTLEGGTGVKRSGEAGVGVSTPPLGPTREQREGMDRLPDQTNLQDKEKFLLANKMSPEVLGTLSDQGIHDAYASVQKKLSDKAMADKLAGKPDKEEVLEAMAKARKKVDANGVVDPAYMQQLREEHQFTSPEELVKQHKALEKEKADRKFEHDKSQANADALGMEELPEEGTDKLHAMDRARDIAKKMNDSTRAVRAGGKPLLDQKSKEHLKDLLDDAINKGKMSQEEIDGIGNDANSMQEDFLNDEHKASIDDDNTRQRLHHEEFLDHAEGTSEESLKRKGHDLDHSKAHELHHYDTNEDGTVGKRTGSSHHVREEDGSVGHKDGADDPDSVHSAVEGMESQHPPKLLGLNGEEKIEQDEHFELMKKAAAGKLDEGDFDKFKALEAKNPNLADPKYKGQVLGAVRHQLSGEDGGEKMSAMGIDGKDQDAAAESSCRPPVGAMPTGVGKAWNPDSHRWCDKEYLDGLKGQLGPGEASYHPDGLHADSGNPEHAGLDQDAQGNTQAVMVTPTGVHKVNPSSGEMKTADGGAVNHADVLGHHLQGHEGGKVDKDTLHAMGMNHSEKHTGEGQKGGKGGSKGGSGLKTVLGKFGRMLQSNKEREQGQPNATGQDRQRARRDTEGSPSRSFLDRLGSYAKDTLRDAAEELPGYMGGELVRGGQELPFGLETGKGKTKLGGTDRWQDKQVRQAAHRVSQRNKAAQELMDRITRVTEQNE